jgi:molybdopterin-dependent oxidoreductase alpha subunit
MKRVKSGGGFPAILYTWKKAREAGGVWKLWKAMRSKNACKTCALGMGGQKGGMVNERGTFPEVCKKSLQAMVADMQGAIKPEFWSTYSVAQLQQFSPREMEHSGRLVAPVIYRRGENYYEPISWEEVFNKVAAKLKSLSAEETFWYFSGRSSNEAGFLLQLFARLYGTNNVNNCSYYCHQASGVGLKSAFGSGTATLVLEDVEHADLVFVIGGNPASNHPRLMTTLKNVRKRGKVVVINPLRETGMTNFRVPSSPWSLLFGTDIASQYVQPHIGGDLALLTGIAKRVVELNAHDKEFLQNHCDNSEAWLKHLKSQSWKEIREKSGVTQNEIDKIAETYAAAKNVVFSWTMGITHHVNGVQNVQAIANLAMLRGMVGRKNAGLMPIRGHSNVQGIGSVGVTPKLADAIFAGIEEHLAVTLPTTPGMDTLDCMEAAASGQLKLGFCLGGNLYGSNPDSKFAAKSLSNLEMLVTMSTTLNTGHAHALAEETIILPVLPRDEEPQATTQESMFNYVRMSDGGKPRHEGPLSEVEVIASIAERVLGTTPIDFAQMRDTSRIREAIAKVVPGFEKLAEMNTTKEEFQIGNRTFHTPTFPTPNGRGQIHIHSLPDLTGDSKTQLRLMTLRSEGQFNTVVYEEEDLYRGIDRRDVILLHPDDIDRLRLKDDQLVTIRSETGELPNISVRSFPEIRAGNAVMYYPEANVLVPRSADPDSKTPAFKNILITIDAAVQDTAALVNEQVTA